MNNMEEFMFYFKKEIKYRKLKNLKPDQYMSFLEKEYTKRTGEKPNLNNPQKYTEKMQYAKIHLNTPLKTKLSDKYAVREWVEQKIGSEYLIPLIDVWEDVDDINFDNLPKQYILKATTGSATNIMVTDNDKLNRREARSKLKYWLKTNFAYYGDIQLHYADISPRVIAERNIKKSDQDLIDYRFICFDGVVYYCWVDFHDENDNHYSNIYDVNWDIQPWRFEEIENTPYEMDKPENFDEMVSIAETLAQGFSHVRVDLYNVEGKIYFGEMTFTSTGGFRLITPEEYNYKLGDLWDITNNN